MILQKADAIGLTEDQREAVQKTGREAHEQLRGASQIREEALEALRVDLDKDGIDERSAILRLDAVLDAERAMKRIHLRTQVRAGNLLTAEQREKMRKIGTEGNERASEMAALEKKLRAKMERVKNGMEAKIQAGEHPQEVVELMEGFHPLMQHGKHAEAEKILDRALKMLGREKDEKSVPDASSGVPRPAMENAEELKTEIAAMRVDDVAWRQIAWKTCLVDGIRASREQQKPILLWVFIDRPVDDKRC